MNKSLLALVGVTGFCVATAASAETYVVSQPQSRFIACYSKEYVPAKVLVNTRGRLVQPASTGWEVSADRWNRVRNQPVYIQTRRVVEGDHFQLVAVPCP